MLSKQQQLLLLLLLQLLLASRLAHPIPLRRLSSRPLHDSSAATVSSGTTNAVGRSDEPGHTADGATDSSLRLASFTNSSSALASPPWELELAPYLADLPAPRDSNATVLRGPPRLAGVFKGNWLRTAYGVSLRPQDALASERGVIVLRLPEDENPGPGGPAPGAGAGAAAAALHGGPGGGSGSGTQLPGGIQELRGELIIRDGDLVTDHDLRFKLRGVYLAAAGTLHAVLEPQLPLELEAEVSSPAGNPDPDPDRGRATKLDLDLGLEGAGAAVVAAGGADGSGYRAALRAAARNLVTLGPAWHRTLIRYPPPPPPALRGATNRLRRRAAAEGPGAEGEGEAKKDVRGGGRTAPASPSPPRPPLELALLQTCELRADFRVYYKGDPGAKSHVQFLRLDQPAPPPSPPPPTGAAPRGGGGEPRPADASSQSVTAAATAAAREGGAAAAAAAATAVRHQRRQLAADTEIYHSTQMQLHSTPAAAAAAAAVVAGGGGDDDGVAAADVRPVYGIPQGMDPLDPDLELVGLVVSPNCDFAVHFNASSVHLERYYRQAVRYSVLVAVVTIAQIVLSMGQVEAASTPSAAARMSLYCVTLQAILDAYQCLLHLTGALVVDALFAAFASLSFLQFLLFAVFEMQQTLLVWRAQRTAGTGGGGGDFWSARRDMSAVYFRFYAVMLLGLLLMFQFRSQLPLLVLALHSWWLPQLMHSAATDTRPPLRAQYVWGMSALRLVSPLYFYGCPNNLLRVETRPGVCVALVVWVGLQAVGLSAQKSMGPRVFVPRAFLPRRYDYHRPATKREMGLEEPASSHPAAGMSASGGASAPSSPSSSSASSAAGGTSAWWRRSWWWWRWWPWPRPSAASGGGRAAAPQRQLASWWLLPSESWVRRPFLSAGAAGIAAHSAAAVAALHRAATGGGGGAGGDGGDVETGHGSKECVICMNPVPLLPHSARLLTPCGHFFHEPCLTRWMEVKMDCPTCRRPLPPP